MSVILATWEAGIERIEVWDQPGQIVLETPISKITTAKWRCAKVAECLVCKCEALSSNSRPIKRTLKTWVAKLHREVKMRFFGPHSVITTWVLPPTSPGVLIICITWRLAVWFCLSRSDTCICFSYYSAMKMHSVCFCLLLHSTFSVKKLVKTLQRHSPLLTHIPTWGEQACAHRSPRIICQTLESVILVMETI
jgi:hypothetical protein